jgi:hypothetical protein
VEGVERWAHRVAAEELKWAQAGAEVDEIARRAKLAQESTGPQIDIISQSFRSAPAHLKSLAR